MRPNILLILIFVISHNAWPKVEPPNYNFSLDQLTAFYPGSSLKELESKSGAGELVRKNYAHTTKKFFLTHKQYKFPIIITASGDQIVDMYSVLPTYFLHDVFHQSLINRFGKQDIYKLYNGTALYTWTEKNQMRLHYSSTCTITCFPLYFSATSTEAMRGGFVPMIDALSAGHL